jgi:hypothetical protein
VTDVLVVFLIAAIATVGGAWLGIVVIAPRITHLLDRPESTEEEPGDRPD